MDKKVKKIILILTILLVVFVVISLLPCIRKTYYKIYLKNKISNVKLDDTIIVTSENNRLDTKTYIKGNKSLTEYYNFENEEEIDYYEVANYNTHKKFTINNSDIINNQENEIEISEDITNNPTQAVIGLLVNWDLKYVEKNEKYYILVFGNKYPKYNQYVFLNAETYLMEKIMFSPDSKYITVDYNYQFNQNIEDSIFEIVNN